jgi:hypothetical protein
MMVLTCNEFDKTVNYSWSLIQRGSLLYEEIDPHEKSGQSLSAHIKSQISLLCLGIGQT